MFVLALGAPAAAAAQGYRVRVETRAQAAAFRGVVLDSIPVTDTVSVPGEGPRSPDGYAVRCPTGAAYCTFFRPGPVRHAGPVTATADATLWGLGIAGLSVRAAGRISVDAGSADVWPGTEPAAQLLEGYAEYARGRVTARLGRQVTVSRLGFAGFDGAGAIIRDAGRGLELQGYAGWGLARGAAIPVTSPALDPLDDFQPRARQVVAGAGAGWTSAAGDVRLEYQREVDPRSRSFVSERVGVEVAARPVTGLRLGVGADYDLAAGWWGSAEAAASFVAPRWRAAVQARRYRPHFDLWTIWGAFSPVPYRAAQVSAAVAVIPGVEVRGRYERYRFDDDQADTPLLSVKRDGWRTALGVTATPAPRWTVDGGYEREFGPGASASGSSANIAYQPSSRLRVSALASAITRPLEFRFNDAVVRVYGLEARLVPSERLRVDLTAHHYREAHDRPDAAAFDWSQWRLAARIAFAFGTEVDTRGLPPAIRILPGDRAAR
jgi:hypothetical protein